MDAPGGKDGARVPARDTQGKPNVITGEAPKPDWRRYARFTVWAVLAILVGIFLVTNNEPVPINFLIFQATTPLWVALLGVLIVGMILGWMASWWRRRRRDPKD